MMRGELRRCRRSVWPSRAATFSSRAARFTAGPMQVKSSRLPPPILPYITWPTCSASPKRRCSAPAGASSASMSARAFARAGERAAADRVGIVAAVREREDRQQAVADELQHLAALVEDRRHLAVEIAVEQIDQLLRRQPLASARVKPRMSESQITARISSTKPRRILPGQDALAGLAADIGVEQVGRGPPQRADFRHPRQRRRSPPRDRRTAAA